MHFSSSILLAASSLVLTAAGGRATSPATAKRYLGSSDMYVFAYTFQPEFCYGQTSYPGCEDPHDYWYTHFTVHGLWPQYKAGGYEHDCTSEPFDDSVVDEIGFETMTTYWPDVKYAENDPDYTEFWVGNFPPVKIFFIYLIVYLVCQGSRMDKTRNMLRIVSV